VLSSEFSGTALLVWFGQQPLEKFTVTLWSVDSTTKGSSESERIARDGRPADAAPNTRRARPA
jgi:hypothetical protein